MTELQALLMGLLQGLTEYLPVSSSGHLTIASALFGIEGEENLTFTIAVHVATVLSTLVILWREIAWLLRGLVDTKAPLLSPERKYILAIVISMIPIGIVGVFFKDYVEAIFGSGLIIVGFSLIITAALLTMSYYARPRQKEEISLWQAFVIGLAQSIAVLPGLSRSGSTIATGLLLGVKKEKMAQFSFLMVIPPILGEALLSILEAAKDGAEAAVGSISMSSLLIGFVAAFVSGCLACKWMVSIVKKGKLVYFGVYCAIVGSIILLSSIL
ncbi:MAG: undecaprenyl-diphosphate phosphatase [Bacteroidaceae bacterium]|nr:undecaprenyl-diphosphate phosphatase [Bacteroidaceae bacterium]MBQ5838574.1 undecaprenyl-diphosphate phosphatase [Bacteroidaceae bacterium]